MHCPVCNETLIAGDEHFICPRHHGVFLTLQNFREATNSRFVNWVYAHWLRWISARKTHCPSCHDLMMSLHNEKKRRFDFEFCPSCFGLWMSSENEEELLRIFRAREKVANLEPDALAILGKTILEHDKVMTKYEALTKVGTFLKRRARHRFR